MPLLLLLRLLLLLLLLLLVLARRRHSLTCSVAAARCASGRPSDRQCLAGLARKRSGGSGASAKRRTVAATVAVAAESLLRGTRYMSDDR